MADRRFDQKISMSIDAEQKLSIAKSRRVYLEHFHLHPIRLSLTFSQEWIDFNSASEGVQIFQFIRSMPSLTNAPLTFTSFVVSHAFEAPQALIRILGAHYFSQLARQIFAILGSLTILNGPADFLANVGTGVRDFFYEPINGLVHGPTQFIEGLETGALSLARGVIVGVVRGAAQVTDLVTLNIAGLTDKSFIEERNAYKRSLADARSRCDTPHTLNESLYFAGDSIARSIKSGAVGMMEQPSMYASRNGSAGLVHGVGKALVGAILKPMVGVGDAVVLVLNHVTDAASITNKVQKVSKRLRRALPQRGQTINVQLIPYDESAAGAQKIVTENESLNDVYIGHVHISSHLIIASERSLWAIDQKTSERLCLNWEEISHFSRMEDKIMKISVFSQTGLQSHIFKVYSSAQFVKFYHLLYIQSSRMGNGSNSVCELDNIPGIKYKQQKHNFGSFNNRRVSLRSTTRDETGLIARCCARVKLLGSESPSFFNNLDKEAWTLISSWGQMFTGLSSRRCVVAGFINGTHNFLQMKSTNLVEGGSSCYRMASKEYDEVQNTLQPGGAMILFAWGSTPSLLHEGRVILKIETNAFVCDLSEEKNSSTHATPLPDYQVCFLEKSYDSSGWWAKYWLLVSQTHH
uniref:Vacuolar protein sorting-associated protein 13 DH-like domain-containing protein n=1 Tax=Eucampia antarctica TaxID=49252 RepID=A0A7S2RQ69_9STRA